MIAVNTSGEADIVDRQLVHVGALPALTLVDRCDACQARAYAAVRLRDCGRRLTFCGHHFRRHEAALAPLVDAVQDNRKEILP